VFDPEGFGGFLAAQPDLGTKWAPRYLRVGELPVTETSKVLKRLLRQERWECDGVWWRPEQDAPYRRMDENDRDELRRRFEARGRTAALEAS
jgi:fatty-acyl-CoA synthase